MNGRENFNDLIAFAIVARERSFTRAAAQVGVSQSALSHTIKQLEARLGIRLLTRTTRSVSPTEAGARLLSVISPRVDEIEAELDAITEFRDKPAGTIRVNAIDHAIHTILWPKLPDFLRKFPDIKIETVIDYGFTDIVATQFDVGIRSGETVARDMVAVRVSPDIRFAVVATPTYLAQYGVPAEPQDLAKHNCINLRLPTHGGLWAWEFEKDGHEVAVRVEGQVIFNSVYQILDATLAHLGVGYMPEDVVIAHTESGRLVRILEDWCQPWSGYHLYYPVRRQSSPALTEFVNLLRWRP